MTKEELEREYYGHRPTEPYSEDDSPNDWANIVQYAEENLGKAFKAIAELEKVNAELKEQCSILADCNTCHSTCKNENIEMKKQFTKAKELIDELEKENAELKEQVENRNCSNCRRNKTGCPNDGSCHNFSLWQPFINPQLTKAKELIKDYLTITKGSHITVCGVPEESRTIYILKLNKEAEQFLKESD